MNYWVFYPIVQHIGQSKKENCLNFLTERTLKPTSLSESKRNDLGQNYKRSKGGSQGNQELNISKVKKLHRELGGATNDGHREPRQFRTIEATLLWCCS